MVERQKVVIFLAPKIKFSFSNFCIVRQIFFDKKKIFRQVKFRGKGENCPLSQCLNCRGRLGRGLNPTTVFQPF